MSEKQELERAVVELKEALRKAILWGESASNHILYREKINWNYLEEARRVLKSYSTLP